MNLTIFLTASIFMGTLDFKDIPQCENVTADKDEEFNDWKPLHKYTMLEKEPGTLISKILKIVHLKIDNNLPSEMEGTIRERRQLFRFNDRIIKSLVGYSGLPDEYISIMNNKIILSIVHPLRNDTYNVIPVQKYHIKILNEDDTYNLNITDDRTIYEQTVMKINVNLTKKIEEELKRLIGLDEDSSIKIVGGTSALQYTPISYKFRNDAGN